MIRIILALALIIAAPVTVTLLVAYNTPCVEEDSTNCIWDAATMGNGRGTSSLRLLLWEGNEVVVNLGQTDGAD